MNERKPNAALLDGRLFTSWNRIHDVYGNTFRQVRPADKHNDTVLYTTFDFHVVIFAPCEP